MSETKSSEIEQFYVRFGDFMLRFASIMFALGLMIFVVMEIREELPNGAPFALNPDLVLIMRGSVAMAIICFILVAKNEMRPSFKTTAYICGAWFFTAVLTNALSEHAYIIR